MHRALWENFPLVDRLTTVVRFCFTFTFTFTFDLSLSPPLHLSVEPLLDYSPSSVPAAYIDLARWLSFEKWFERRRSYEYCADVEYGCDVGNRHFD